MKTIVRAFLLALVLPFLGLNATAQQTDIPRIISYQGYVTTADNHTPLEGTHLLRIHLFTDPNGTDEIWTSEYMTTVSQGVFSIALGTGKNKLPSINLLNRPLWVGVRVDGGDMLKPLTQLAASPYALNVANNSITLEKLSGELASTILQGNISQNPQATLSGSLNTAGGTMDVIAGGENNTIWIPSPANVGSWDNIGGGEFNRIDTLTEHNHIGGGFRNRIFQGGNLNVIGGGDTNTIDDDLSFIGGGTLNRIINGAPESVIGGGRTNTIDDNNAVIGGGVTNEIQAGAFESVIAGGDDNTIQAGGANSFIGAGEDLIVNNGWSAIVSGRRNTINSGGSDHWSFLGGGEDNTITGAYTVLAGGGNNNANGSSSAIGGGNVNTTTAAGIFSSIPGGDSLTAQSYAQFVTGYNNFPQGNRTRTVDNTVLPGANDRLAIFGNGTSTRNENTNAFEISYNGHSIVYDINGTGASRPAILGAQYRDNTCVAWGQLAPGPTPPFPLPPYPRAATVNCDFGVASAVQPAAGTYVITLSNEDPFGNAINWACSGAVTATILGTNTCLFINATPIAANTITVTVTRQVLGGGPQPMLICEPVDAEIMFHLFARPTKPALPSF